MRYSEFIFYFIRFRVVARGRETGTQETLTKSGLQMNQWNFVAAVYNYDTEEATVYINNLDDPSTMQISKRDLATDGTLSIGSAKDRPQRFKGRISCLRIYKEALTSEMIKTVQNCDIRKYT